MEPKQDTESAGLVIVELDEARRALAAALLWWNETLTAERANNVLRLAEDAESE